MAAPETTAIAYFAFNRPAHTLRSLQSLAANEGATSLPLYVFADAPRNNSQWADVEAVRHILAQVEGFRSVQQVFRERSYGCANNIIDGISTVLARHEQVIVVEDDLVLSRYFLRFVERVLTTYHGRSEIFSVSAGGPPSQALELPAGHEADIFLAPRLSPWGWGTWRDRWSRVDWGMREYSRFRRSPMLRRRLGRGGNDLGLMLDLQMSGRIDAWDIRFNYHQIMSDTYSLYAREPYVRNIGLDGSGTHCRVSDRHDVDLSLAVPYPLLPPELRPDPVIVKAMKRYHDEPWLSHVLGLIPGVRAAVSAAKSRLGKEGPILGR